MKIPKHQVVLSLGSLFFAICCLYPSWVFSVPADWVAPPWRQSRALPFKFSLFFSGNHRAILTTLQTFLLLKILRNSSDTEQDLNIGSHTGTQLKALTARVQWHRLQSRLGQYIGQVSSWNLLRITDREYLARSACIVDIEKIFWHIRKFLACQAVSLLKNSYSPPKNSINSTSFQHDRIRYPDNSTPGTHSAFQYQQQKKLVRLSANPFVIRPSTGEVAAIKVWCVHWQAPKLSYFRQVKWIPAKEINSEYSVVTTNISFQPLHVYLPQSKPNTRFAVTIKAKTKIYLSCCYFDETRLNVGRYYLAVNTLITHYEQPTHWLLSLPVMQIIQFDKTIHTTLNKG